MISKKRALKKVSPGLKRPDFFWDKGKNVRQAIGKHTDVTQASVASTPTVTTDVSPTAGSTQPQSPDAAEVTRNAIAMRVSKPPKFHDAGMTANYSPPRPAGYEGKGSVYAHAKKKLRGRNTFA